MLAKINPALVQRLVFAEICCGYPPLSNLNFHRLEFVCRGSETQIQGGENST